MKNVKIQGLSELISRVLRPSLVIFSWSISAPLTKWNCSRRVSMKYGIFFRSHYRHLIVLEALTEMIVTFSWEISALLTKWNCSRRVCMKHLIFFQSHYGHLIVLEGLTEMIVTFSFWWSITPYIPNRPSIFLKSEIKMLEKY